MSAIIDLVLRILIMVLLYAFLSWVFLIIFRSLRSEQRKSSQRDIPKLILIEDLEEVPEEKIFSSPTIILGRDPNSDFVINDETISAKHSLFTYRENQWWLEDLHSTNGTFLNQLLIEEPTVLTSGDELRIGRLHFTVKIS
ncbi:MAG: FHA domain-containing protein [Anaerolineaceae bacterium]|nr:FHA domain-containing protein [Anaerolineaceae bacterium]